MSAVVLLSGGIDSATALALALKDHTDVMAVSFRYGSLHETQEMAAAQRVAEYYDASHRTVQLDTSIFKGAGSALLGETKMPEGSYKDGMSAEGPSPTVVPFRNSVLLSLASAVAFANGYQRVYAGMHASDHTTWAYPDCSPEFLGAFANALYVGTLGEVRLIYPFVWMTKMAVVKAAAGLFVPAQLTYSCYTGQAIHCGKCPTCTERIKAFMGAGYRDPVPYDTVVDWGVDTREWPV